MRKLWVLALKEVKLAFRDVGSIVTMLVTPLALTLAIAAAFGSGGGNIQDIPVLLLNHDTGPMGQYLIDIFTSPSVSNLVAPEIVTDEAAARTRVDKDSVAALVIIPADFSDRLNPFLSSVKDTLGINLMNMTTEQTQQLTAEQQAGITALYLADSAAPVVPAVVEIYVSPGRSISMAVVQNIVKQGLEMFTMQMQGTSIAISAMSTAAKQNTLLGAMQTSQTMEADAPLPSLATLPVRLTTVSSSGRSFNWLDYSAVSMAILFLMFAVTSGGRTLLAEREGGTLPRLLVTATPAPALLLGKMAGIVLTGLLQVAVLWGATSLIGAYWGAPIGVIVALLCLVMCATGVGAVISAWAQTPAQATNIGTAFTLVGAAISGSFLPRMNLPLWVRQISLLTPNAWGIEIFSALQAGKNWDTILPLLGGTLLLTAIYYAIALAGFRRQFK